MTTEYALTLSDVTCTDGSLRSVSLAILPGEIAGVVGPAAAGKSSLLAVAGGRKACGGEVRVFGIPTEWRAARRLVGSVPEHPIFPAAVTVRELLGYYARLHGVGAAAVREALDLTGWPGPANQRIVRLGRGDLHRLALAQAILGGRRVLLLDEILSGLDAVARRDLRNRIAGLAANGVAVLMTARDPVALERLPARVLVLREGRIVRAGPLESFLAERVLEVVLDAPPPEPPPGFRVTATGLEAPLAGRTAEAALALCRAHRLAVRASRVRVKSLEEVVLDAHDSAVR
jgi:ABC-type multidrug transport system ATPase subunit